MQMKVFAATIAFAAALAVAPAAYAVQQCNKLKVTIDAATGWKYDWAEQCHHGKIASISAEGRQVNMESKGRSIECIVLISKDRVGYSLYEVRQNFCSLKAGVITLTLISGVKQDICVKRGSYSDKIPGAVVLGVKC